MMSLLMMLGLRSCLYSVGPCQSSTHAHPSSSLLKVNILPDETCSYVCAQHATSAQAHALLSTPPRH